MLSVLLCNPGNCHTYYVNQLINPFKTTSKSQCNPFSLLQIFDVFQNHIMHGQLLIFNLNVTYFTILMHTFFISQKTLHSFPLINNEIPETILRTILSFSIFHIFVIEVCILSICNSARKDLKNIIKEFNYGSTNHKYFM